MYFSIWIPPWIKAGFISPFWRMSLGSFKLREMSTECPEATSGKAQDRGTVYGGCINCQRHWLLAYACKTMPWERIYLHWPKLWLIIFSISKSSVIFPCVMHDIMHEKMFMMIWYIVMDDMYDGIVGIILFMQIIPSSTQHCLLCPAFQSRARTNLLGSDRMSLRTGKSLPSNGEGGHALVQLHLHPQLSPCL